MTTHVRTSVNQPPSGGTQYPFKTAHALAALICDFYLSYEDDACTYALPLQIRYLYGFGTLTGAAHPGGDVPLPVHARDILITDATGRIVFDSTEAVAEGETAWGNRLIHEWHTDEQVARIVFYSTDLDQYEQHQYQEDAAIDAYTYRRLPERVRGIRVGLNTYRGNLVLQAGLNVSAVQQSPERVDGGQFIEQLLLDGVAGAGLGRLQGCEESTPVIRRINLMQPDASGRFAIQADDCIKAKLPLLVTGDPGERIATYAADGLTSTEARSALELHDNCPPCCKCDYFVNTYRGLYRVWNQWADVAAEAEAIRDTYTENRERWLAQLECRSANPLQHVESTETSCKTFSGGSVCNMSKCCMTDLEIRFTFQQYTGGVLGTPPTAFGVTEAYLSSSATSKREEAYVPQKTGSVVRFFLGYADPQTTAMAKMRTCFTGCNSNQTLKVTMSVHAPDPAPAVGTDEVCILPTPAVPDDVQAIWNGLGLTGITRAIDAKIVPQNPAAPTFNCDC